MPHVQDLGRFGRPMLLRASLLMIAVAPLLGCGGYYGKSEYQKLKEKQQSFIDMVTEAGGSAKLEGRTMHGLQATGWFVQLSGAEMTDDLVETMVEYAQKNPVFELNLSKSTITDEQLAQLDEGKVLQKCFNLDLSDTAITDAGIDKLSNFHVIYDLKLKGSQVTPAAVQRLGDKQMAKKETPEPFRRRPKADI